MSNLTHVNPGDRMSGAVVHNGVAYLSGQVALGAGGKSVTEQTQNILDLLDATMEKAGTDKSKVLSASIWLSDISTFDEMNAVWDAWVADVTAPARATVEAKLAAPQFTVEIALIVAV
ncbi:RidA family protein [Roseovarius pacificus]|uniref:RidA family protein n=1 Tax=Roseovarius pacificus TaxID=337701 RepID=UPI002A18C11F|nr:RidA family protein [Roseovarius pacificus]